MHIPTQVEPSTIFESLKPPPVPSAASPGDVNKVLADVETYLQRLRAAQKAQEDAGTALAERTRRLERSEGDLDKARQELLRQQQAMQDEHAQLVRRLQAAERNALNLAAELESTKKELDSHSRQLQQASGAAQKSEERVAKLERTVEKAKAKLEEGTAAREAAAEEVAAARKMLATYEAQAAEREVKLSATQRKLEEATRQLGDLARTISEQKTELERGAAALAVVEQQHRQIEQLTTELAEIKLRSDTSQVQRLEQRVAELTEALRQARGQSAGNAGLAMVEQRNAALEAEIHSLKVSLQAAQLEAAQAKQSLQEQIQAGAAHATHDAAAAEHGAKVAALTAELERLREHSAQELRTQLQAQSHLHQQELARASSGSPAELQTLRARVKELERGLAEAKSRPGSTAADAASPTDAAKALKAKAERISLVADHLRRRRTRLDKLRKLMGQRAQAASNPQQLARLESEQAHLQEIRRMLAASEHAMVRRWARPKALTVTARLALIAVVCAIASWFIADHYFPARISASVGIEARTDSRQPLNAEAARSWRTWHTDLLRDPAFIHTLSRRLAERRLDQFSDPELLAQRLVSDLTVDGHQNGMLVLTLAGHDEDELTSLLDILTATLITESGRSVDQRPDRAAAVVTAERKDGGQIRYSSVNPVAIEDSRVSYAGPIFGVLMALIIALTIFVYTRLCGVKRVFDDDSAYAAGATA